MLRGIDLDLPAHTLIRIEGANGTGKSTLLKLLARIDAPTEGRITGRRPRTAYVPERFSAALPFTAAGYLVHLGRVHGLRTSEAADRAQAWLARFGAAGHARTPLPELSKGTSQKVAVAQALLAEPELLVLDEAWTGLDAAARDELDRAVAERVAAGSTVVFVDHDPRRLAGAVDVVFRVEGHGLAAVPVARAEGAGPQVRIEAAGPPGAALPAGLPGTPERTPAADGAVRLTVAATHSDALLRALLAARPPWHIRHLTTTPGAAPEPEAAPHPKAAPAPGARSTPEAP
ncbi:ATP-binding cassette domain-containing protein [Streptomyces atratus]|uniref:ATP-binding cassette domain-containing protein n=1 Tax=Streptomyces atratus TaxID=1893 RepID=UPI00225BE0AD|nr:ATP-binding cassette domain-containing protein [Streptomyces atratus]MCX5340028.1 ATP-binding cassette domain-containing protein [Streptomyces atratus]